MFGFLKPKRAPEGPVAIDVGVEIDRPASEVYALIDWASPRNAKRELGHQVEAIRHPDRFRVVMSEMPDLRFDIDVIEAVPGQSYAFSTEIVPRIGRLEGSKEHYSLKPIGDQRCRLQLTSVATFERGLTMKQFTKEVASMTFASHLALAKLKAHAELGADALKQFE